MAVAAVRSTFDGCMLLMLCMALLIRFLVGLQPYSGHAKPPRYGDYEAQRHWMEITVNLPKRDWYRNTTDNDLDYWGLDYPPLSAYQSWLYGKAIAAVEPDAVALFKSRGYESLSSKLYMRWSVIASDVLVFLPAALLFVHSSLLRLLQHVSRTGTSSGTGKAKTAQGGTATLVREAQRLTMFALVMSPAAIVIDHGHFQYNDIGLGCALAAAAAVINGWEVIGSVLFCLSINHKQMCMYYAPAFFAHLLGRCLQRSTVRGKLVAVLRLAVTVIATFAVVWSPFLYVAWRDRHLDAVLCVARRLVPLQRGLFEDYVANAWCASSVVGLKWKQWFDNAALARMCLAATLAAILPAMVQQIWRPSRKGFLYCVANSAFGFFLFSFQVHEKSILLPLLPIAMMAAFEPRLAQCVPTLACFSMYMLLKRDGVTLAYIVLAAAYPIVFDAFLDGAAAADDATANTRRSTSDSGGFRLPMTVWLSAGGMLALHAAELSLHPPPRLAYLFDAVFACYAAAHFIAIALYLNWRQWSVAGDVHTSAALSVQPHAKRA